jgi:DNA-binding NarL/FixJ family response regulator
MELPEPLTKKELEVLSLMTAGLSNKEIAESLGVTEATIKTHASTIFSKLGVRDRVRAVLKGLEIGYI